MKKLFWEDPYRTECKAIVTEIKGNKIKVNQSIFYAFSGGQASDEGTINGIKVKEATKEGDKEDIIDITYELEEAPNFKVGEEVEIKINKERRDNLRNLHSAAHILYYITIEILGKLNIVGSNVSPDKARMDFLYEKPLTDKIQIIEDRINKFIEEGHDIIMKPDENKPDLQWWTCNDWKMPCGGTHVKNSKEIRKIKLKRKNVGKEKERIEVTFV